MQISRVRHLTESLGTGQSLAFEGQTRLNKREPCHQVAGRENVSLPQPHDRAGVVEIIEDGDLRPAAEVLSENGDIPWFRSMGCSTHPNKLSGVSK
ncbi:hypothetical protein GCM10027020_32300 [Nocardioides salsibiostraticola]